MLPVSLKLCLLVFDISTLGNGFRLSTFVYHHFIQIQFHRTTIISVQNQAIQPNRFTPVSLLEPLFIPICKSFCHFLSCLPTNFIYCFNYFLCEWVPNWVNKLPLKHLHMETISLHVPRASNDPSVYTPENGVLSFLRDDISIMCH